MVIWFVDEFFGDECDIEENGVGVALGFDDVALVYFGAVEEGIVFPGGENIELFDINGGK